MKLTVVAAALVLCLASVLVTPSAEAATTTKALTISNATANPLVPFKGFDGNPTKLFDLNGDGKLEIIAQNDNQWVYVFDSKTGAILAEVRTTLPAGWGARSINGPEVAIFDSGGTVRLIVVNSAAYVTSYRVDLSGSTSTKIVLLKEWERCLTDCFSNPGSDSKPVLADLDKDGKYEILVSTEEFGLYALRENGQLYWKNCLGGGNGEPVVADLNLDGWPDVVFGSDGGVVSAHNGRTGGWMWGYNILAHFDLHSASIPVGVGIGQLDGKGGPDIVVGARDSHHATDFSQNHAMLLALDSSGKLLWAKQDVNGGNPLTYTHPIIVDADGDGQNEVYWADWNTMGHKPGNWEVTGPANFYRYDPAGNMVWKQTLGTYWNNKDLAIADADGDGKQEVLANGPGPGGDGIWYLDVRTGAKKAFVNTHPWQVAKGPVVADLWGTGTMQWVVQAGPADSSNTGGGILVYNTNAPYNAAYPHLPYPSLVAAPTPPPPTGGSFDATFKLTNPNQWWQQVDVTPNPARTVTKVEIRHEGGFWQPMTKNQWGAWTSSYYTPAGTMVEFLARDPGNAGSQSLPFAWLDGTTTKGSTTPTGGTTPPPPPPPPPPPANGTFGATFTIRNPNEWWEQVTVKPTEPRTLANTQIRLNGGPWQAMTLQSYGDWTASLRAVAGTKVEFLATDTAGQRSQSLPFTWLDGSTTKGSTAPTSGTPPPSTFTASFVRGQNVNAWWVEVSVTGNQNIASVAASVNSGAWTQLSYTDWGTWAKSMNAPSGSQVQFRAIDEADNASLSSMYTWG